MLMSYAHKHFYLFWLETIKNISKIFLLYIREEVVNILGYVLLGMFLYAFIIPIIEQFSTVVIQWLENLKGKLMVDAQKLQNQIIEIAQDDETTPSTESVTNVIGFAIPDEIDYEEDYEEDDD